MYETEAKKYFNDMLCNRTELLSILIKIKIAITNLDKLGYNVNNLIIAYEEVIEKITKFKQEIDNFSGKHDF